MKESRLELLIDQEAIAATVNRLAQEIDRDYQGRSPVLLGILKGSFILLADLIRATQVSNRQLPAIYTLEELEK